MFHHSITERLQSLLGPHFKTKTIGIVALCLVCVTVIGSVLPIYAGISVSAAETEAAIEQEPVKEAVEAVDEVPEEPIDAEVEAAPEEELPTVLLYEEGSEPRTARIINGVTYVSLRAFCEYYADCEFVWSEQHVTVMLGEDYRIEVGLGLPYIAANGRYIIFSSEAVNFTENGICYVPLRAIGKALGVEITWQAEDNSVLLHATGTLLESGDTFYNADTLYWLSRIISAESGAEPLMGQIAVGNVVLNRVSSPYYPDTVKEVVLDRNYGTQFTPAENGTLYKTPLPDSVVAAKLCLDGFSLSNDILFFINPDIAVSAWIAKNRTFAFTLENHSFYY